MISHEMLERIREGGGRAPGTKLVRRGRPAASAVPSSIPREDAPMTVGIFRTWAITEE